MSFQNFFSFNDQIFTTSPPPFLTFFIFTITSPLVHTSVCLFCSIVNLNFPETPLQFLRVFIRLSMLVTSTSVSPAHSVIISRTKSILGLETAVKSMLFGKISSRADAKSINGNGSFLFTTQCKIFSIKV